MATVVFVSPHQDDETLTMGAAISNHVAAGHDVHVVLATDGINSGVRAQLGLSRPMFTRARDDEFRRACVALGVPPDRVHVSRFAAEDGELTVARACDIITAVVEDYPGAWIKTHSDRSASGRHPDHVALGAAAVKLAADGTVTDLRLYVEPYVLDAFRAQHGDIARPESTPTPCAVLAAVGEYKRVDVSAGIYGIGYRSTPTYFDLVEANPVSYRHVP